jgi:hypothetical protein
MYTTHCDVVSLLNAQIGDDDTASVETVAFPRPEHVDACLMTLTAIVLTTISVPLNGLCGFSVLALLVCPYLLCAARTGGRPTSRAQALREVAVGLAHYYPVLTPLPRQPSPCAISF